MPKYEQPELVLIDPNNTDLLYFILGHYLFGFDILNHVDHVVLGYANQGMDVVFSSSLLAWKLPPVLVAAPGTH